MFEKIQGTGVAMVTPFNDKGSIDYKGLESLVNHLISGGVDYLVVQGTTGESATLTAEEKVSGLEFVLEINKGRVPIVFGHGGNNTRVVTEGFKADHFSKVDAVLSVSPYYNKPTQEGIYQHYKAVAEKSPVPVILYNVPGRTGSNVSAGTTLRLAKNVDNIVAVKEASGDLEQLSQIVGEKPDDFLVISGDDALTLPIMAVGGMGVISVVANAFPKEFSDMVKYCLEGNYQEARKIHLSLLKIMQLLFSEGNPGGVKAVLKILGICEDHVRLPLWKISDHTFDKLNIAVKSLKS